MPVPSPVRMLSGASYVSRNSLGVMRGANVAQKALPVGGAGHREAMPPTLAGYVGPLAGGRRFHGELSTGVVKVQGVPGRVPLRTSHCRPGRTPPQPGRGTRRMAYPVISDDPDVTGRDPGLL